ncbi:hypothetical protein M2140_001792 [Clostridiales Family XIII bacterium PM5-7]
MNKYLKAVKIDEENRRIKNNTNRFLKTFCIIFVVGYVFFFSSNLWMPVDPLSIVQTKLGESIEANGRTVTPLVWTYSKDEQTMELIIEISNTSLDGIDEYEWTAVGVNTGFFDVETVVNTPEFVVLHVKNVSNSWTQMSVRMDFKANTKTTEKFNTIKMYADESSIDRVEEIKKGRMLDYQKVAIAAKIRQAEDEIRAIEAQIKESEKRIAVGEDREEKLSEQLQYQIGDEKDDTVAKITDITSEVTAERQRVEVRKEQIEQLQEKIALQKKKAKELI